MKRRGYVGDARGLTLPELLIAFTLTAVILSLIAAFLQEGLRSYDRTVSETDLQLKLRSCSDFLLREIRLSREGEWKGKRYPSANAEGDRLFLFTGTPVEPATVHYYVKDRILFREVSGQSPQPLLTDVSRFYVTVDGKLVTIQMTVDSFTESYHRPLRKNLSVRAAPRTKLSVY